MNKILFGTPALLILWTACNLATTTENTTATSPKAKNISSRNYGINRSNSYNDLFIDSMAVENIIADKKIRDSLADRIRSFYNTRNYQFAWFSGDGLTEQARGFWNIYNHYLASTNDTSLNNKGLRKTMNKLVAEDSLYPDSKSKTITNAEVMLTSQFIRHTLTTYEPKYVKRKEMERFVPVLKADPIRL